MNQQHDESTLSGLLKIIMAVAIFIYFLGAK